MQHPISITVDNNNVSLPVSEDGVMMMFIQGVSNPALQYNTAYLLTQLADGVALGLSEASDEANNVAMFQQVNEFYDGGINDGALLWLVIVPVGTAYATYCASEQCAALIRYTGQATPVNRAKMLGVCYPVPQTTQSAGDFPADVLATIPVLQAQQQAMFKQGFQWSAIVDGYNMSSAVTPATIGDMSTYGTFAVSLCITGTQPNGVSGVGLALGRFARISVGHGFGEVADGPVTTPSAYLTNGVAIGENIISGTGGILQVGLTYLVFNAPVTYNNVAYQPGQSFVVVAGHTNFTTSAGGFVATGGTPVGTLSPTYIDQLGIKQYLFLRTWANHAGFYWNDGATCTSPTQQLSSQEYNRVANALSADALTFFIGEMGANLPINTATGSVSSSWLNVQQGQFQTSYINPLVNSGDISGGSMIITGPNFNTTKTLNFTLTIVPTPILGSVTGVIQFSSTL
jgi:hypothetical protein